MNVSGKESILNGIFRVWYVPQKSQSPLVKHWQVSGHNAVQFLKAVAKDAAANCLLSFYERCYRRHNRILSEQPRVSKTPPESGIDAGAFAHEQNSMTFPVGRTGSAKAFSSGTPKDAAVRPPRNMRRSIIPHRVLHKMPLISPPSIRTAAPVIHFAAGDTI